MAQALSYSEKNELASILSELERREQLRKAGTTVVGIVHPVDGHTHSVVCRKGEWQSTFESPDVYLPAKLEEALTSRKRFVVIIGGRGSGKSVGVADICLIDAKDNGAKTYCLREYQTSIKNSIHSLLKEEIKRLEFGGFDVMDNGIKRNGEDSFQFAGLARNVDNIKSAHGFKRYQVEEAQFISADSLKALTPTARKKPVKGMPLQLEEVVDDPASNVSIVFIANPGSSEDPFSKRFIAPFKAALDRDGRYEDDLHLIIMMNYSDNPWYAQSGLEGERKWDYDNLERALYDHIWCGAFNDSVEHSLIKAEWFDACIDAHKKLGFVPVGTKIAAHDPSDEGADTKGFAVRHGSVVQRVEEKTDGNVNEGGHWAAGLAIQCQADSFSWDADGMGIALGEQMSTDLEGKHMTLSTFRGSESPDNPTAIYQPAQKADVQQQKTIGDTFKNKRAQYYFELRDRCYRTYRAVVHGEYHDPAKLISFDSSIDLLHKLRAELCRMPIKPNGNGLFELYTKQEMKSKFKMASPNLGDSVMMLMRSVQVTRPKAVIPRKIRPMGR